MPFSVGDVVKHKRNKRIHIIKKALFCPHAKDFVQYATNHSAWHYTHEFELIEKSNEKSLRKLMEIYLSDPDV